MITHIRMKNFKSWEDSGKIELASLTGFFGTNSSGKSSLLQMLLLLKQTAERDNIIFFGSDNSLVNLGNFREVIHGHKAEESLELEFGYEFIETHLIDLSVNNQNIYKPKIDSFIFKTVVIEEDGIPTIHNLSYVDAADIWKIGWQSRGRTEIGRQFINGTQLGYADVKNCYGTPVPREEARSAHVWDQKFLKQTSLLFEKLFSHVYYLGPARVNPRRSYTWEGGHPEHPGQWGNQAIDALLSARARNLKTSHEAEEVPIEQRVSHWLQEMGLAHSFSLDWTGRKNYEVRIQKTSSSPPVTLADMGYGLTQFLPGLVLCYYAPAGSTLILEQPGIHLHPKVQSQLADLLIEVVTERKLQILVESHSEHLLTRLQLGIAEEKISTNDTALYFCENENGVSNIKPLEIDELGNIKSWPKNFFGDVRGDLVKMTRKQMERQEKVED